MRDRMPNNASAYAYAFISDSSRVAKSWPGSGKNCIFCEAAPEETPISTQAIAESDFVREKQVWNEYQRMQLC
jgi:wyosine [tRNA(Phe)-imidazoG37] synthetase (radical SAM superfamily)